MRCSTHLFFFAKNHHEPIAHSKIKLICSQNRFSHFPLFINQRRKCCKYNNRIVYTFFRWKIEIAANERKKMSRSLWAEHISGCNLHCPNYFPLQRNGRIDFTCLFCYCTQSRARLPPSLPRCAIPSPTECTIVIDFAGRTSDRVCIEKEKIVFLFPGKLIWNSFLWWSSLLVFHVALCLRICSA